jgi:hypothetical protein
LDMRGGVSRYCVWHVLTYADVCWRMLVYAGVCGGGVKVLRLACPHVC